MVFPLFAEWRAWTRRDLKGRGDVQFYLFRSTRYGDCSANNQAALRALSIVGAWAYGQRSSSRTRIMTEAALKSENEYLKLRNAQLQEDVIALQAEVTRMRQQAERLLGSKKVL
jgi:hypothetical protein